MRFVYVILQCVFSLIVFTCPGLLVLSSIAGHSITKMPTALIWGGSVLISSVIITLYQMTTTKYLSPKKAKIMSWVFLLVCFVFILCSRNTLSTILAATLASGGFYPLLISLFFLLAWSVTIPFSSYCSILTQSMGDLPLYYAMASDISIYGEDKKNYFIGDYIGGTCEYIRSHMIPSYLLTFFFGIFGINQYSLYVYCCTAGSILLYLLSTFIHSSLGYLDINLYIIITAFLFLTPTSNLLCGMGTHTIPGSLAFLVFSICFLQPTYSFHVTAVLMATSLIFLFFYRPECRLLFLIAIVAIIIYNGLFFISSSAWLISITLCMCLVISLWIWKFIPNIMDKFPPSWKNLSVFFLKYNSKSGKFEPFNDNFNYQMCRINFSDNGDSGVLVNEKVGHQIKSNPIPFIKWLVSKFSETVNVFVRTFSVPTENSLSPFSTWLFFFLFISPAFFSLKSLFILLIIFTFLFSMPFFNAIPSLRHSFIVCPIIIGMDLIQIAHHIFIPNTITFWIFITLLIFIIFTFNILLITHIRSARENNSYKNIISQLKILTHASSTIAASYPQLINCLTLRRSVGCTYMAEFMTGIINKFRPDYILVDEARSDCVNNYWLMTQENKVHPIPDYDVITHDRNEKYIIFKRQEK